ncbi:RNA-directed DNA polymerase, eukaryota, reverse transcriptase zinc-binding domain protein [Tanacetum coccineum]|uniref:RNA-directed DNA polymerase, eukaryota, reverse transcriptase zinc-binding domain protein n=1 Tax=Tanacetum coccineum TaxID=301880 RepID=A0ABQ4X2B0_9ASTR
MARVRSSSKRKVKIPAKFGDTVCELTKKKDDCDCRTEQIVNDVADNMEQMKEGIVKEDLNDDAKNNTSKSEHVNVKKSFIQAVKKNNDYKSELELIPTGIEEGREVVVMFAAELKYNLSRMWGKYGFRELIVNNGMYLFKFNNEEGLKHVLERGPWMVRNKPLLVQKWNPSLWKPVIMDQTTTEMCNKGVGMISYARVLVEVNSKSNLKNKVEICYKNAKNETSLIKFVNVQYDWLPPKYDYCNVFVHTHANCSVIPMSEEEIQRISSEKSKQADRKGNNVANPKTNNDVRDKRMFGLGNQTTRNVNDKSGNVNLEYRPKNKEKSDLSQNKDDNNVKDKGKMNSGSDKRKNGDSQVSGKWNVDKYILDSVRRSASKYAIFATVDEAEMGESQKHIDMSEVEKFLNIRKQPTYEESKNWNLEMKSYFKRQWEKLEQAEDDELEDVLDEVA